MAGPLNPVTDSLAGTADGLPWRRVVLVIGGVGAVIALLAFGFTRDPKAIPSPLVGRPAPNFSLAPEPPKTSALVRLTS